MTALIVVTVLIVGSAVVALALCRAAQNGDRIAGRHQFAHLGRQRSIDLRPVRPAPFWRNP